MAKLKLFLIGILVAVAGYLFQEFRYIPHIDCPIINTTLGSLRGYTSVSRDGREFFSFLGIPFAQPPIGPLRFEPPLPAKVWEGVREATSFGSDCPQMSILFGFIDSVNEDCLYLNVYTPARDLKDPKKKFPVMVYIYGGMFMEGKTSLYGPEYFMDEEIVLVTMHYRLGTFGFLNTGDGVIRGNMGLKDQNMALRWVRDNIEFFGGKPEAVTLFGQSAGSASTHYHILSPMSKGLFAKAISQSGVAINPWALTRNPKEQAIRLGKLLSCPTESTEELVRCLKKAEVKDILATHTEVLSPMREPISIYTPTLELIKDENAFLVDTPENLINNGQFSKVPWLAGVTSHEGLVASTMVIRNSTLINGGLEGWKALAKNGLYYPSENEQLTEDLKEVYFGNAQRVQDLGEKKFFQKLTDLFSDRHFFVGFAKSIREHAIYAPTFAYYYNYPGQITLTKFLLGISGEGNVLIELITEIVTTWFRKTFLGIEPEHHGVCHSDELFLFFKQNIPFFNIHQEHDDYEVSQAMTKLWARFAHYDNHKKEMELFGTKWYPVNPKDKIEDIKYLIIGKEEVTFDKAPFRHRLDFWNSRENFLSNIN